MSKFYISEICDTLSNPVGGSVTITTDGLETKAQFSCTIGYTMTGSPNLTCRSDGTWDQQAPSCGGKEMLMLYLSLTTNVN